MHYPKDNYFKTQWPKTTKEFLDGDEITLTKIKLSTLE